jgi:hypothetical protein
MRMHGKVIGLLAVIVALTACSDRGRGGTAPTQRPPETYSATVTDVEVVRSADALAMPVAGLPADGAELTVR